VRVASGVGWSYSTIDKLTLPEVYELFEFWKEWPPVNELLVWQSGWEKPLTLEEKLDAGAMGPADFLKHYQTTGGKLPTQ
jgi:hypothetical protein